MAKYWNKFNISGTKIHRYMDTTLWKASVKAEIEQQIEHQTNITSKIAIDTKDAQYRTENCEQSRIVGGDDIYFVPQKLFIDTNAEFSFGQTVWYYGVFDVIYGYRRSLLSKPILPGDYTGSIIVSFDMNGNLNYSITYQIGSSVYVGHLQCRDGEYSMDFLDAEQPKFRSVEFLIAHLIEEGFLQQVSFDWLINNVTF